MKRRHLIALYLGGALGPFGGLMTASILPELGDAFGVNPDVAASSVTAYFLPYALTMLVSGRLAGAWGVRRMLLVAYGAFAVAAVCAAFAPNWPLFLAGFVLMGMANAFTTPLILSVLGVLTPRERLGRMIGYFSAVGSIGHVSSPLVSGVLAQFSWTYVFFFVAAAALLLLALGLPRVERPAQAVRSRVRLRISWSFVLVCVTNFVSGLCMHGLAFLVAVLALDSFGSGSAERGVIIMVGGVVTLMLAPLAGALVDRWGAQRTVLACLLLGAVFVVLMPFAGFVPVLAALWGLLLGAGQAVGVGINKHVLGLAKAQSAVSFVHAFKFFGSGLAPMIVLPVYLVDPVLGFALAATVLVATAVLNWCGKALIG